MIDVVLQRYRPVFAVPGIRTLVPLMFVARIPFAGASYVLTLHVVLTLHHGYGAAGLVGALATVGMGFGAPLMGRVIDRFGLRAMLVVGTLGEGTFWLTARLLPFPVLLVAAVVGGLLTLPVMSVGRQAMAAAVPVEHRRTALSVDSMGVELSYMAGPALGVLVVTRFGSPAALIAMGTLVVAAGIALYVVNPPMREPVEESLGDTSGTSRPPRRDWLTPPMLAVLVVAGAAIFVLSGTEVATVAALRDTGQLDWTGTVVILQCAASLLGGLVYGALRRTPRSFVLMELLAVLLVPAVVASGAWWWLLALALVPSNLMCAPTLAATAHEVNGLAPAVVRGEATGLYSAALTFGGAFASPLIGVTIDHGGAGGGYLASVAGGLLIVALAVPLGRRHNAGGAREPASSDRDPELIR